MNIIERVKNILLTPKTEWDVINGETASPPSLLMGYVLPLAVLSAIGSCLHGLMFPGLFGMKYFIIGAVIAFAAAVVGFYISVYVIDMLAPSFASEKNMGKSSQLVAYSATPSYIAGFLSFIPAIGLIIALAGWAYGIYLMYLGIGPLKKTPEDKKVVYMVVSFLVMIVINFVVVGILGAIIYSTMGFSRPGLF